MTTLSFFIPGVPAPGGSKKAFRHRHTGKIIVTDDSKRNAPWREVVATFGLQAMIEVGRTQVITGPLSLSVDFVMPRPKHHFRTGRNAGKLKSPAPHWHTNKPDRTKLLRALEDALTGIIWRDDTQVVTGPINKHYGEQPGALVRIKELT